MGKQAGRQVAGRQVAGRQEAGRQEAPTILRCQSAPMPKLSWPMRMRFMTPTLGSVSEKTSVLLRSKSFLLELSLVMGVLSDLPSLQVQCSQQGGVEGEERARV